MKYGTFFRENEYFLLWISIYGNVFCVNLKYSSRKSHSEFLYKFFCWHFLWKLISINMGVSPINVFAIRHLHE